MLFVVSFLYAWFIRWITEIAVTDRRMIYKRGFINRHTEEMNMDKVDVGGCRPVDSRPDARLRHRARHRNVGGVPAAEARIGRNSTASSICIAIASPLALRNAITAK